MVSEVTPPPMNNQLALELIHSQFEPEDYIEHHGIMGMKWGVRRYQNEDGSYTESGRKRYGVGGSKRKIVKGTQRLLNDMEEDIATVKSHIKKAERNIEISGKRLEKAKLKNNQRKIKKHLTRMSLNENLKNIKLSELNTLKGKQMELLARAAASGKDVTIKDAWLDTRSFWQKASGMYMFGVILDTVFAIKEGDKVTGNKFKVRSTKDKSAPRISDKRKRDIRNDVGYTETSYKFL